MRGRKTARASAEEPLFGQVDANGNVTSNNEVVKTRFAATGIPNGGWSNASIGNYVSKLKLTTNKVGPNVLLKVMAGDLVNATTQYYYQNAVTNTANNTSLPADVLSSIIMSITGSSAASSSVKGGTSGISNQLIANPGFINQTEPDAANAAGNKPKAYLTVLFFDERFNYITTGSNYKRVNSRNDANATLTFSQDIQAPKNGYAYIYLSNESDEPVYFDNFNVKLDRGRIIEEDHYYAFGLKIAGISSQKLGDPNEGLLDNKNLYNDKELLDDADLDWYDYGFRNYDAQIGRFTQLDPLTWDYPDLTNYQYASNDPIANIDIDGLEGGSALFQIGYKEAKGGLQAVGNFLEKGGSFLAKTSTSIAVHTLAFTAGAVNAFTSDHLGGAGLVDAEKNGLTDSKGLAFQIGQKVGHAGALLAGITELAGEGAGEDLSLGFATVPVAAAVPFSLSAIGKGAYHLANDKIVYSTGGKSSSSTPKKYKSVNQLNQDVKTKRAPNGIKRFDKGQGTKNLPEDEVHFDDGSSLYRSGKWRHDNGHKITNKQKEYLEQNGWTIPK